MSTLTNASVSANIYKGGFDASWASIFSFLNFPQYYPELIERHGAAFGLFEFLKFAGRETTCRSNSVSTIEKGAPEKYVTIKSNTSTSVAGATLAITINEWGDGSTGVSGACALAVNDKVLVPAANCTVSGSAAVYPQWFQVTAIATTAATPSDTQITIKPLLSTVAVASLIAANTKLMVTGGNYAPGAAGGSAKTHGYYSRTYYSAIKRTPFKLEGSQQSTERYLEKLANGGYGMFSETSIAAEFRHNHAINYEIILGVVPNNVTQVNDESVSNTVRGTKGTVPWLADSGCKLVYTGANGLTVGDFDYIKKAFISQGVTATRASMWLGPEAYRRFENNALDVLKEYSGGTDLLDKLKNLMIGFKVIKKNGVTVTLHELSNFGNPNTLGNYNFDQWGFVLPEEMVDVTIPNGEIPSGRMSNTVIAYKNYNGENRERVFNVIPGVNGLDSVGTRIAVDSYDRVKWEILSEFIFIFLKPNQGILLYPDA